MKKSILTMIIQEYSSFTKSEKKIADFVLKHSVETQHFSITDLSAACKVAVSTISVFCRKLKLAGFNEFKLELAKAALLKTASEADSPPIPIPADENTLSARMASICDAHRDTLAQAFHLLNENILRQAVTMLLQARQVVCLGQGNHSILSMAAWSQFSTISDKFRTVTDSHLQAVLLSSLIPQDVVLYFSYSGATHELADALALIRERGAKLILVTRFSNTPAAQQADLVLICGPNEDPLQFGSVAALIAQLYIVDVLFQELSRADPQKAEEIRGCIGQALSRKCN